MKVCIVITQLVACLSAASAFSDLVEPAPGMVVARQDNSASESSSEAPSTSAQSSTTVIDRNTASPSSSGKSSSGSGSSSGSASKTSSRQTFGNTVYPGSVSMITPAPVLGKAIYKVGDYVTFSWNYTDVRAKPSAIDVMVSCSAVKQMWTLTQNMSYADQQAFTWDSNKEANNVQTPLGTEDYTLVIKDSADALTKANEPGYLGVYSGLVFGMYTPEPYTPLADWQCPTCNSAGFSDLERSAIGFALGMVGVTVFSFTWFVSGLRL